MITSSSLLLFSSGNIGTKQFSELMFELFGIIDVDALVFGSLIVAIWLFFGHGHHFFTGMSLC